MKTNLLSTCMFTLLLTTILPMPLVAQWETQYSCTDLNLQDVFFIDNENGWVVGDSGIILNTNNSGDSWNEQISDIDFNLKSVYFINPDTGWIVGGTEYVVPQSNTILRTVNGGETWEEMYNDSSYSYCLNDVYFTNNLNGYAVGDGHVFTGFWGTLLQSIDGGETWFSNDSIPPSWFYRPLNDIHFIDSENGWLAGGGVSGSSGYTFCFIMKTNDGGITWEEQFNYGTPPSDSIIYSPLYSISFTDNNNGWAVGGGGMWLVETGSILHTSDGGTTWELQESESEAIWKSTCFVDTATGWIVGGDIILHTPNSGITWLEQSNPSTNVLNSIHMIDENNGWIVGENGIILHTTNGGVCSCLPDGITFSTQAEIDSFQMNYLDCIEIEGDVTISGENITNLVGLSALTFIGGNLKIYDNNSLHNLSGLDNLTIIGGDIKIGIIAGMGGGAVGNDSLVSISSLNLLEAVSGDLVVVGNGLLTNLNGLQNINNVAGSVGISHNDIMSDFSGLESLQSITGSLGIASNGNLLNLIGLESLVSIGDDLYIGGCGKGLLNKEKATYNESLTTLMGLSNLESIGGSLSIDCNPELINLTGLENLISIEGELGIAWNNLLNSISELENLASVGSIDFWNNDTLSSLSGLDNINPGTIGYLSICCSNSLASCDVQSICEYLASPDAVVDIHDNATGCNSQEEVEEACAEITDILESTEPKLLFHPNPVSNKLFLSDQVKELSIYNQIGQQVLQEANTSAVDVSGLPKGLYIIELLTVDGWVREKVVVR